MKIIPSWSSISDRVGDRNHRSLRKCDLHDAFGASTREVACQGTGASSPPLALPAAAPVQHQREYALLWDDDGPSSRAQVPPEKAYLQIDKMTTFFEVLRDEF